MTIPTATYRIQFRNGMTFDRAAALVPYLKRLGISHLYASPVFTATTGSTHGYDVTDANEIDPAIGGRKGFDRMVKALKESGLGLILDIVPNHMAASLENRWWRDVIEHGPRSRYAHHFDIDWTRPLTLPFLGDTFENVLERDEIHVQPDPETGHPAFAYYDSFYPLTPESWQDDPDAILNLTDKSAISALHQRQPWRLTCWRDAPHSLSYRRFFEITGLVGVRVEDKTVFDDTHRLILELVHSGVVDGLRIDHIDGLADPKGYLERLRQQAGPDCYITVEKILADGEQLPPEWPVSGTTGYEFIAALSDALVDGDNMATLSQAYEEVLGRTVDMANELRAAKLLMSGRNFEGEFNTLLRLSLDIATAEDAALDETAMSTALRELLVAFPVYRTYGTDEGLTPADDALLQNVVDSVKAPGTLPDPEALDFLQRILTGELEDSTADNVLVFRTRFQQLTGPLMAKSVEDTLFFRQHMALALNEVGSEPLPRPYALSAFHKEMQTRRERQPDALSTTSTHDTKRGEDTRARLYTLTEAPEEWAQCVVRWREMNKSKVVLIDDGAAPRSGSKWMIYQALAGAWPVTLRPDDHTGLKALEDRFLPYVEKALREEKLRTSWDDNNDAYEQAVLGYVTHLLSADNQPFLVDFHRALQPFIRAGLVNSLTQAIIKLTAPGVPDIYQGSEAFNFSLVDPDNRLEPDFFALASALDDEEKPLNTDQDAWFSGRTKQQVIARLARFRQQKPRLFRTGDYLPLSASGSQAKNVIAFARTCGDEALIVVVPRLVFAALAAHPDWLYPPGLQDTSVMLTDTLAGRRYRDLFTGKEENLNKGIDLASGDGSLPVRVLYSSF
ncbi:TPA: malto-oligosyltrehalose synthase [Kluyvera intermedia]|nr:malto-oligosyltrehalose synthase [Kluyvera intermedia]